MFAIITFVMLFNRACPHEIDDTEFTVKNLIEGRPYEFRVAAVNEAGPGEYSDNSAAIKPAPPPCLLHESFMLFSIVLFFLISILYYKKEFHYKKSF